MSSTTYDVRENPSQARVLKGHSQLWDRTNLEHYFCQFEKRLPQPEIKSTRRIHLEIPFTLACVSFDPRSFTENLFCSKR